jgi:hypothetical protein
MTPRAARIKGFITLADSIGLPGLDEALAAPEFEFLVQPLALLIRDLSDANWCYRGKEGGTTTRRRAKGNL